MKLSTSVPHLKRMAKRLSRDTGIPLHAALDRIAAQEGYARWSLLANRHAAHDPAAGIFARLAPGDMLLIAARPGQGKTLMGLRLAVEAMRAGHDAFFFSLEYAERHLHDRFAAIGADPKRHAGRFTFDNSDAISASYIADRMAQAPAGTLAVVDYLQILDQDRSKPDLMAQVRDIRSFARAKGHVFAFISQIDRSYDPALRPVPSLADIRLPDPLNLSLFDKACFLQGGEMRFGSVN